MQACLTSQHHCDGCDTTFRPSEGIAITSYQQARAVAPVLLRCLHSTNILKVEDFEVMLCREVPFTYSGCHCNISYAMVVLCITGTISKTFVTVQATYAWNLKKLNILFNPILDVLQSTFYLQAIKVGFKLVKKEIITYD